MGVNEHFNTREIKKKGSLNRIVEKVLKIEIKNNGCSTILSCLLRI